MSERTFSEKEIQSLLERATQLQASKESRPDLGLTLGELEQIAADAGIEPEYLRAAVREAESGIGLRNVHGHTNTHVFVERTVPGHLTEHEWHDVVLRVRNQFTNDSAASFGLGELYTRGTIEQLGSTREWRHTTTSGITTLVSIRSSDDMQHVRISRRVGLGSPRAEGIGYGLIASMITAFIAGAATDSVWILAMVLVSAIILFAPTIEWLDRRWRAKKLSEIEDVADDIARIVHNESAEEEGNVGNPAISLDTLPDAEDTQDGQRRANRLRE